MAAIALAAGLFAAHASTQNLLPNGDFERGSTGWTLTAFNDPIGTTGFAPARVTGNGPSMAVFADFQTLTSVRSATFRSDAFPLPAGPLPLGLSAMWVKPNASPMPSPSVNRVELRVFDATNTRIFAQNIPSPGTQGEIERTSWSGTINIPAAGQYTVEVFLRHSNLAGIPFVNYVDDVFLGALDSEVFGLGCQGSGAFVPVMNSVNVPELGSTDYRIELHDAFAPTAGLLSLGISDTTWMGVPLPFALGGGCDLKVGPIVLLTTAVAGSGAGDGTAAQVLPVPNDTSLRGGRIFSQWLVVDSAAANPFGLSTTAGMWFLIR